MQRTVTNVQDTDRRSTAKDGFKNGNLASKSRQVSGDHVRPKTVTLYVKGLPREFPEVGLYNLFSLHGKVVTSPKIIPSAKADIPCRFAFVEVESEKDATSIIASLNSQQPLYLQIAITKKLDTKLEELPPCLTCGADSYLFCSVCQGKYCSTNCQLQDWPKHSLQCGGPGDKQSNQSNGNQRHFDDNKFGGEGDGQRSNNSFNNRSGDSFSDQSRPQRNFDEAQRGGGYGRENAKWGGRRDNSESSGATEKFDGSRDEGQGRSGRGGGRHDNFDNSRGRGGSRGHSDRGGHDRSSFSDRGSRGVRGGHSFDRNRQNQNEVARNDDEDSWDTPKKEPAPSKEQTHAVASQANVDSIKKASPLKIEPKVNDVVSAASPSRTFAKIVPLPPKPAMGTPVMPINVNSLEELFVQELTPENAERFETLNSKLTAECEKVQRTGSYAPEVGELVGCKFEDVWCRGKVISVTSNTASLFYLDYGNIENAKCEDLVPLSSSIGNIPALAIHIYLKDVPLQPMTPEVTSILAGVLNLSCNIEIDSTSAWPLVAKLINEITKENINELVKEALKNSSSQAKVTNDTAESSNLTTSVISKALASNVPLPSIPQGCVTVFPCFVISPQEIFVQELTTANAERLEQLNEQLAIYCEKEVNRPRGSCVPQVGELVGCKYEGTWCRGNLKIIDGDTAKIFYIDYGNTENVKLQEVVPLSSSLCNFPCIAIKVCLAGLPLKPVTQDVMTILNGILNIECTIEIEQGASKYPLAVKLMNVSTQENINELVKQSMEKNTAEIVNNASLKSPVVSTAVSPKASTTIFKALAANVPFPSKPAPGTTVVPIFIVSPKEIYIQEYTPENAQRFTDLNQELSVHCEQYVKQATASYVPEVGELVGCRYEGEWCRGHVKSITDNIVSLFYIDYGNTESVKTQDVVPLSSKLESFPIIAFPIYLAGLPLKTITPDVSTVINGILNMSCTIEVEQSSTIPWAAKLTNVATKENINELLKEAIENSTQIEAVVVELPKPSPSPVPQPEEIKVQTSQPNFTIDNSPKVKFPIGTPVTAVVMHVEQHIIMCVLPEFMEASDQLVEEITKDMESSSASPYKPEVNEICLARFSEDGRWYRAGCLDVLDDGALLLFADYGNMETVPIKDIRPIEEKYMKHQLQAVMCTVPDLPQEGVAKLKDQAFEIQVIKQNEDQTWEIRIL